MAGATLVFLWGARSARRGIVGPSERRCFQVVNGLPRRGFVPVWSVMQAGTLAGPLVTGAVAAAAGERRMKEGLTTKEAFRCLKRFIAREVYNHLPRQQLALDSP